MIESIRNLYKTRQSLYEIGDSLYKVYGDLQDKILKLDASYSNA